MGADTTLADIFGVDYNARGELVARDGAAIDAPAMLQEMLGVIAEFGGDQLKSLTDPAKWVEQLKAGLDLGRMPSAALPAATACRTRLPRRPSPLP